MNSIIVTCLFVLSAVAGTISSVGAAEPAPRGIRVSENRRFLVTGDQRPFFWLGDTAWELFHRLRREDAVRYLDDRAARGFTVIQAVALAEFDGLTAPNAYGHLPLKNLDPTQPDVKDGAENDYWDHVDFIVAEANQRGLVIGFLPTWGDKWNKKWGVGPEVFTPANAETYGEWLGRRYQPASIVWILGGDRPVENDTHREIIRAMAKGLRRGDGGAHLITYHPSGGQGSSDFFPDEPWLDFHMRQNGHEPGFTGRYEKTRADYDCQPVKPVLDGEPIYEDHPVSFNAKEQGHSISGDVRRPLYWDLFSGACGHTYGHHSVWQFWTPQRQPVNNPLLPWTEAIGQPGADQMRHAKDLLLSRPYLTRIPDQTLIIPEAAPTSVPGAGRYAFVATRDEQGSFMMIYAPVGRRFRVRTSAVKGDKIRAWWFNPRDGSAHLIGESANTGEAMFTPRDPGEMIDWVLVIDDAGKLYPAPGAVKPPPRGM